MPVDRSVWVRQAREVFAQTHPGARGPLTIHLEMPGGLIDHVELADETAAENGRPLPALSELEERILRTVRAIRAEGRLAFAKVIAARLHVANDGDFRAILRNLCARRPPVLESSTRHGYWEPGDVPALPA